MEERELELEEEGISKSLAVTSCTAMAVFYVAILYSPTLILRLPPPDTFKTFLIRRFTCAAISSVLSLFLCALILPIRGWEASDLSGVYGIRLDHMWQAMLYPLLLTSLMYGGSFVMKLKLMLGEFKEQRNHGQENIFQLLGTYLSLLFYNISAWRNYVVMQTDEPFISGAVMAIFLGLIFFPLFEFFCVVNLFLPVLGATSQAPVTEELVFRACMIPLLLCGGFGTYAVMFFCPIFFSLAHLSHFFEIYIQQSRNLLKASMVIGLQLGYTVVFGSYASFLFIRTGHLIAPLFAHVFCNIMGLPIIYTPRNGIVSIAFLGGVIGFVWLLYPVTNPGLYNDTTDGCRCWQRFCAWN